MTRRHAIAAWAALFAVAAVGSAWSGPAENELSLPGGPVFHVTPNAVTDLRTLEVPGTDGVAVLWTELLPEGGAEHYYAISLDAHLLPGVPHDQPDRAALRQLRPAGRRAGLDGGPAFRPDRRAEPARPERGFPERRLYGNPQFRQSANAVLAVSGHGRNGDRRGAGDGHQV